MSLSIGNIIQELRQEETPQFIERKHYDIDVNQLVELATVIGTQMFPEKFVIDDQNRFAYENALKWLAGQEFQCLDFDNEKKIIKGNTCKGLYLAGSVGSGKSVLLEIISKIAMKLGVLWYSDGNPRPLTGICHRSSSICDDYKNTGEIVKYKNSPILYIQDLGTEQPETMHMGNRNRVLREILEHRGDRPQYMTLISSNNSPSDIDNLNMYGERVVSRLYEMSNYLIINGKDRRKL
ncbi:MAG: hypothetical protein LBP67_05160 [Bacteroidales bacterium]|nr:hypothetical protein [Bacteroidales bacterium]